MSFASGCTPVSFDKLFEVSSGDKVSRGLKLEEKTVE